MTIKRREFLKIVSTGISLTAFGCVSSSKIELPAKPNFILCMADDQGWGDMAYNGHPVLKTPNFDEASTSALRFDRFYAAAPVCSPTRGSVLTGRHPNRFGCFKWGYSLRPQEISLAEVLKNSGYVCGHFGKWHLGSVLADSPVNPGAFGFDEWFSSPNFFDNNPILSREGKAIETHGEGSMVTVEAALEFIRQHANGPNPFLAVIWFGSPHRPHEAEEYDCALYPNQSKNFQHFYGEITAMDRAFGKLRKELRNMGIEKNTLLWFCSDNGGLEGLSRTGGRGHKSNIYEGGLRVPAFLEWPSQIPSPKKSGLSCSTSDIFPTILDILGIEMENQRPLDGISLYPLIKNGLYRRSKPIGFWDYPAKGINTPSHKLMTELLKVQMQGIKIEDPSRLRLDAGEIKKQYPEDSFPGHSAWLDWPWKLHRIQEESGLVEWELYNLEQDPMEQNNLKDKYPDRNILMRSSLEKWLVSVVESLNGKDY